MAIKTINENLKYVKFTENNDNEGESWNFFIPIDGNEKDIKHVAKLIEGHDSYEMDIDDIYTREDALKLCNMHDSTTYMPEYNMTLGWKKLPKTVNWDCENPFYKGGMIVDE